jgi:hypothetical protein
MRGYNPAVSLLMSRLSDAAYGDLNVVGGEGESAALSLGADEAVGFDFGVLEALVVKFGEDVVVSFRGSSEFGDFIADARIALRHRPGLPGKVHAGLSGLVVDCFPVLIRGVLELIGPDGFIDATGHSKGGAEALFFGWLAKAAGHPFRSVWTFGSPAVGDRQFSVALDREVSAFAHVFGSDIVARAPVLLRFLGRYVRAGSLIYHTRSGRTLLRPSPIRYLLDGLRAVSRRRGRRDHGLENYIEAAQREVDRWKKRKGDLSG